MKTTAILLIILSLATRVMCCGKSAELSNEINTLTEKQNLLTKGIDDILLSSSEMTSYTKALTDNITDTNLIPVSYNITHSTAIALSQ